MTSEKAWILVNNAKLAAAIVEFLGVHQTSARVFDQPEDFLKAIDPLRLPALLVFDLFLPRNFLSDVKKAIPSSALSGVKTVWVSRKEETAEYRHRAAEFPNARLVAGSGRLVHRVLESIGEQLGFTLARGERVHVALDGELRNASGSRRIPLKAVDLSHSGVRIVSEVDLAAKSEWQLHLKLPGGDRVIPVEVIRSFRDQKSPAWQAGLRFRQLRAEDSARLNEMLLSSQPLPDARKVFVYEGEPVRAVVRTPTPARLGLKVRLSQSSSPARVYLQVVDLSPLGFRSRWAAEQPFPWSLSKGNVFQVSLSWPGHSMGVEAELSWSTVNDAQVLEAGFRFRNVSREAGLQISRLLSLAQERGLRGNQEAAKKAPKPAAPKAARRKPAQAL